MGPNGDEVVHADPRVRKRAILTLRGQRVSLLLLRLGFLCWGFITFTLPCFAGEASLVALEREVHALVNQHRQAIGLRLLTYNEEIVKHARRHSQDMASGRGGIDHRGAEERHTALSRSIDFTGFAENVATNNYAGSRTAKEAVRGWLKSPGHRRNIEGNFTLTGVGIARSATGFYFFTHIFLTTSDTRLPRTQSNRSSKRPSFAEPHDYFQEDQAPSKEGVLRKREKEGYDHLPCLLHLPCPTSKSYQGSAIDREPRLFSVVEAQGSPKPIRLLTVFGNLLSQINGLADDGHIVTVQMIPRKGIVGGGAEVARHAPQSPSCGVERKGEFLGKRQQTRAVTNAYASGVSPHARRGPEPEPAIHQAQVNVAVGRVDTHCRGKAADTERGFYIATVIVRQAGYKAPRPVGQIHLAGIGIKGQHPELHLELGRKQLEVNVEFIAHDKFLLSCVGMMQKGDGLLHHPGINTRVLPL